MKQIYSYYVSNGTVKVKLEENSRPISITHSTDFDKDFHGIDLGLPSYMYQSCCILFFFLVVFNFYDVRVFASTFWCIYIQKVVFSWNFIFRCRSLCIFDLFFRYNLFARYYLAPSCHYSHEFFLNSHWLGFIVR